MPDAPVRIQDRRANRGVVVRDDVVGVAVGPVQLVVGPMQATRREDVRAVDETLALIDIAPRPDQRGAWGARDAGSDSRVTHLVDEVAGNPPASALTPVTRNCKAPPTRRAVRAPVDTRNERRRSARQREEPGVLKIARGQDLLAGHNPEILRRRRGRNLGD